MFSLYSILPIVFVWLFFGFYNYSQYNTSIKSTNWFPMIALSYGIVGNLIWAFLCRKLNQAETVRIAMLWDSGVHMISFLMPIILFGDKMKSHTIVGIALVFVGVSILMFWEKVF